jgi:hypothetical protein
MAISVLFDHYAFGMFPFNFFRPWDINLRPHYWCGTKFQITGWAEGGLGSYAYNAAGNEVNALQIWGPTQNAVAMFQGFPLGSPERNFLDIVLGNPIDNGISGHLKPLGDFKGSAFGFAGRYYAPHNITLSVHMPFYAMSVKNVRFFDLTQDVTMQDVIIRTELTDNFVNVVAQFDPTLNLKGWDRIGPGDLLFMAEWLRDFPQPKPILRNVGLNIRSSLSVPTGLQKKENDILSIPFGLDGAVGLIFGSGIMIHWWEYVAGGIDVEFMQLFGNIRERRIKTSADQSDLVLLAKARAHKEFGFTHRFNLFLEMYDVIPGLSASITYQFWKHGEDKLALNTNAFSNTIANTAQSLQDWTFHQFIYKLQYDAQLLLGSKSGWKPQVALFYKMPFNGQRALVSHTLGAIVSLSF